MTGRRVSYGPERREENELESSLEVVRARSVRVLEVLLGDRCL